MLSGAEVRISAIRNFQREKSGYFVLMTPKKKARKAIKAKIRTPQLLRHRVCRGLLGRVPRPRLADHDLVQTKTARTFTYKTSVEPNTKSRPDEE